MVLVLTPDLAAAVANKLELTTHPPCAYQIRYAGCKGVIGLLAEKRKGCLDNPLVIECFDFNSNGTHKFIGKVLKSVMDLENLHKERIGAQLHTESSARKPHMRMLKSQLFVDGFSEKKLDSFIDYISSGFELNFMVAVDFTASNANPRHPDSLHYIDPSGRLNAYQQVYPEGTHLMIPWFERPVIYDVRARPHLIESTSGSRDLQMVKIGLRVLTRPVPEKLS